MASDHLLSLDLRHFGYYGAPKGLNRFLDEHGEMFDCMIREAPWESPEMNHPCSAKQTHYLERRKDYILVCGG